MPKPLAALVLFGLGLGAAMLALGPAAAHATDGTLTGSVGSASTPDAYVISLSSSTVPAGTYTFDITDYSALHDFDLVDPGGNSVDATPIAQTGTVSATWTVTLAPGTYTFRCDVHLSMQGTLTVTGTGTSTATSTSASTSTSTTTPTPTSTAATTTTAPTTTAAALRVRIASVHETRRLVVVRVSATFLSRAVVVLSRGGKRVARAAGSAPGKLRLRPGHALAPGRYRLRVTVTCCGASATTLRTIRIR
jgi:plastocyanin